MTVGSRVLGGRYRLGSVLGQGGMSVVYRAEDLTLGRTVAVKVLREALGSEPEFLERFRREAQSAARLNHPNIIAVYDVGQDGLSNYIVMEYVEGRDLREVVRDEGALAPEQIVDLGCQIAAALEYAHRTGLVHRDIKSQNVLVTAEGKVKVADFGIALARGQHSITEAGMVIGSVHYMAPEQAEGKRTTAASDVYSLGVVLFELATGRLPFTAESPIAVARLQLEAAPPAPQTVNPRLPLPIADVILACLKKDPEQRPASAALVAAALRGQRAVAAQGTAHVPIVENPGAGPGPGPWPDRESSSTGRVRGRSTRPQPIPGTERQPVPPTDGSYLDPHFAEPNFPESQPHLQTDVLLPDRRQLQRRAAPPPRRRAGGGLTFWPLVWITILLAVIGGIAGVLLADTLDPQRSTGPTPTAAPVIVATAPPQPTAAPAKPTEAPKPTTAPPKPTAPPVPTATAVPAPVASPTAPPPPPTAVLPTAAPARPTAPPAGLVNVPLVMGKSQADASKMIRDAGLTVKVEERRAFPQQDGTVVEQNPSQGQVLKDSTITIVIGRNIGGGGLPKPAPKPGFVLVPNVEGMDEKEARQTLEGQGFKVEVKRDSAPDRKGQVIDQNPGANDTVPPKATVRITIGT